MYFFFVKITHSNYIVIVKTLSLYFNSKKKKIIFLVFPKWSVSPNLENKAFQYKFEEILTFFYKQVFKIYSEKICWKILFPNMTILNIHIFNSTCKTLNWKWNIRKKYNMISLVYRKIHSFHFTLKINLNDSERRKTILTKDKKQCLKVSYVCLQYINYFNNMVIMNVYYFCINY